MVVLTSHSYRSYGDIRKSQVVWMGLIVYNMYIIKRMFRVAMMVLIER